MTRVKVPTCAKVIYSEKIGSAEIELLVYGYQYWVSGTVENILYERSFDPSPYPDKQPYNLAIHCYDITVERLRRMYNFPPANLGKPNFQEAVK